MEVVSLRRNRIKKNIIMSTVSKPYIIFVSILFLLLSIYPFYVLFLYPMFQFLSIFVPFDPSYVVIPFSIFTYVYIMYEVFYNRRSILCWSSLFLNNVGSSSKSFGKLKFILILENVIRKTFHSTWNEKYFKYAIPLFIEICNVWLCNQISYA